ncbi:bifunctional 2-polyprenyl-6-hydroxyphenol methylase/3-demethylubiquinol 3-O-methyltransferase UbiG [Tabrizicola sp.]|uniref:class I SAM-dependent methyltransferase n=1 Tax=Tabrizicola sp. TaxID=2005166 RepID=UPI002733D0D2|nr:class I SAM-dependent methyltransferase [Tabrizicola sp.]MDP3195098.1 class I SAM-dependent methyltransferase [Tabrizicola sp.]MDZ4066563.1 class I SAM-dependent methyltransferase [Tabrizicola sp.]
MADKIDTQAVGLDVGLAFIRWLTGAENLHYGLWSGLEVTAGNLRAAQDAYTAKLFGYLPEGPLRILDIGGGAGETAKKLLALGHRVEIVVPSPFLAARCRETAKGATVHECTFEAFPGQGPFDLCLFSESFQYIPLAESLPKCAQLLVPGGQVLIADCFRTEAYQGRHVHGPQPGGGHPLAAFRAAVDGSAFTVDAEEEITEAVAPSIDLEQRLFHVLGHGVTRISDEIRGKRPTAHWALGKAIGLFLSRKRRENLMQRLTGASRTSEAFRRYNSYRIIRLRQD